MKECHDIMSNFNINEDIVKITPHGSGHINDTFLVVCPNNKYVLQRINHHIFKRPDQVMENIINICNHIKDKVELKGGNPERETLSFVSAKDGKYYTVVNGNYYRVYNFVDDAITYQTIENPIHFYNAGKAFGKFQQMLSDFPADTLYETIEKFHNTQNRYQNFRIAAENDIAGRKSSVSEEIKFVEDRKEEYGIIVNLLENKELPLRVTHNDTKLNNVLIDKASGEAVCVIDLDTVMPSTLLYDFGDAIRFGASTAEEDEKDLSKVQLDLDLFEKFAKGFLEEMKDSITELEVKLLPLSAKMMTIECGIRFLTDHLDGDVYFKIQREGHNLDRARTQFKLVKEMEEKEQEMNEIINRIYNNL